MNKTRHSPWLVALAYHLLACGSTSPQQTSIDAGCDETPLTLATCVDESRYSADLELLAVPRNPGSSGWQAAQNLCAQRLTELGFVVENVNYGSGTNVIGRKAGATGSKEVLISAHYDSVAGCPGADDNASGVAGLLEMARVLSMAEFSHTLVVACWDEEESGLIGSAAFATHAASEGTEIIASLVFEMIGYKSDEPESQSNPPGLEVVFPEQVATLAENQNRGDFIAVIGDQRSAQTLSNLETFGEQLSLPVLSFELTESQTGSPLFADFQRSDHASFWKNGYPGIMLTDTANFRNEGYHCSEASDDVARLDHGFAAAVIGITTATVATELGLQ